MSLSTNLKNDSMQGKLRSRHRFLLTLVAPVLVLVSMTFACTETPSNKNGNSTGTSAHKPIDNSNARTQPASSRGVIINIKEPDRYSVAMTISAQAIASEAPASMMTQQFTLTRLDADRRWAFTLPAPLGQVVYLEKSGLKYAIFTELKQYVEVNPAALGVQIGATFTPGALAERLNSRVQYDQLGVEPLNGRTAMRYRLSGAMETGSHVEGLIFVDQDTGLPLRSELNITSTGEAKSRVIVEARDIQLNPDRSQFDVPEGMKKVPEAKQQLDGFASTVRSFADVLSGAPPSPAKVEKPANDKNAGRKKR